ncbi:MAG TPA: hypothetical protein VGG45_11825 [Terracidiphilus sp.]|jgi:hypothetical protein
MNKKLTQTVVAIAMLALAALAPASASASACTNKILAGAYGFTIQGTKLGGIGFLGQQVGVAMATFDGNGNFTQIDSVTIAGNVVSDFTHTPAAGTYTVNSDCTGSFTINFTDGRPPVTADFVVVDKGNEIDTVVTSAGGAQGILATSSIGKKRFPAK